MMDAATGPAPRLAKAGDTVRFNGGDALVVEPPRPGDPRSKVVLAHVDQGKRRFASDVPRGLAPGCWSFPEDAEAARVKTPLELVAEAKARGERVPEVGMLVLFAKDAEAENLGSLIRIVPTRATIRAVHSLVQVDLDVHDAAPPDDPDAKEPYRCGARGRPGRPSRSRGWDTGAAGRISTRG